MKLYRLKLEDGTRQEVLALCVSQAIAGARCFVVGVTITPRPLNFFTGYYGAKFAREEKSEPVDWTIVRVLGGYKLVNLEGAE